MVEEQRRAEMVEVHFAQERAGLEQQQQQRQAGEEEAWAEQQQRQAWEEKAG